MDFEIPDQSRFFNLANLCVEKFSQALISLERRSTEHRHRDVKTSDSTSLNFPAENSQN